MAACDVFCLPSYSEGCPNVVIEALSCGRPVVATEVGGIPELVKDDCGMLVPARDSERLRAALDAALSARWDAGRISAASGGTGKRWREETFAVCRQVLERARRFRYGAPKVSVLMVTYNRPQMIGRALRASVSSRLGNGSCSSSRTDPTRRLSDYSKDWLERDERIRYFRRGTVGSIAEASNFGLAAARGEYVAILDDDDYWIDRLKLERQVEFLEENPGYVGCGGGYVVLDQDDRLRGKFLKPEDDAAIRARALLANPVANSTAMFRRVVEGVPVAYDVSMRQFADWDFWLTMGARGKLYNFPFHLAHYTLWEGGSSFQRQRENGRAALRIIRKHRRAYRGFVPALILGWLYLVYACLPEGVRRASYASLSALKKALAGRRMGVRNRK